MTIDGGDTRFQPPLRESTQQIPFDTIYSAFPTCETCLALQIVHLFMKYDEDGSCELDMNEMQKLMFESDVSGNSITNLAWMMPTN